MGSSIDYGSASSPAAVRYYGKYAGIVLDNGPPDTGAHRGEVLVQVGGILEEDPSDATGDTQRPLEIRAKPCLPPGFFFVPEPQDRVWVEFVAGELEIAVWTGVWYPRDAPPRTPDGDAPTADQKVLRTAAGHVVLLDNTDGSAQVVVVDGVNGNRVTFDQSGLLLEDGNGNSVTLDSSGIAFSDLNGNGITMDSSGITIQNAAGKAVVVGTSGVTLTDATGSAQPAALAPLLDWLLAHQHVGNLGAPTPLFPANLAELGVKRPLLLSGL